ncbi:hypothetical protein CASFOL_010744 [Castilleja foliolosa]|uniref:Uncharacterized protein n=1 Tax=Castilleja foliolosa TaxID=1961234 RepID=A0ABD3DXJ2_9LAMI
MARGEWLHSGRCSYKRTTIIVCSVNIAVALYVLHSLYTSLYMFSFTDSQTSFKYTPNQIRKMEESNEIRKASEPTELIELATQLKKRLTSEERLVELPQHLKRKLTNEIIDSLRSLDAAANATEQREVIESWRKETLKEAKKLIRGNTLDSTILPEEASAVARALSSDWNDLLEVFGLWIPIKVINKEHEDKPEGEEYEPGAYLVRKGLMNYNHFEQEAAINTLSTLMSIIPGDIYAQFEKHFISLPDRIAHDTLSEVDIQVLSMEEPYSSEDFDGVPESFLEVM